jgi:hypothetical protein
MKRPLAASLAPSLVARPARPARPARFLPRLPTVPASVLRSGVLAALALLALASPSRAAQSRGYAELREEAEALYAEGSYALAHERYREADRLDLPAAEASWVDFRLADTLWRSQAATQSADATQIDLARQGLETLLSELRKIEPAEDRPPLYALVLESLGDFWWRRDQRNWSGAFEHYRQALEWWAGARDVERARTRYLEIVWRMTSPDWGERHAYYGYYGNQVPRELLQNVLEVARTAGERARAHYLLAMTLRYQGGDAYNLQRIPEEFEAALETGKESDWHDDALFHYAQWLESSGRVVLLEDGGWRNERDYARAVELYRQLMREYEKGETAYHDQARQRIEDITRPTVGVNVSNIFLPGSEIEVHLSWRNLPRVDLAIYVTDLTRDLSLAGKDLHAGSWLQGLDLGALEKLKVWSKETGDDGRHRPGTESLRLDEKLLPGAYVVEATGGGQRARDVILVSDAALVLKASSRRVLAYFAGALDGAPIPEARVKLCEHYHDGNRWHWRELEGKTDASGVALFDPGLGHRGREIFASARLGERQAFSTGTGRAAIRRAGWKVYAFTDRPAYRPEDTVQWKVIARRYDGSVHETPAGATVGYRVHDPRGNALEEGTLTLNAFGSAWGSIDLAKAAEDLPLGEYHVELWSDGSARKQSIGRAALFRLEEHKLPEFEVTVRMPEEDGRKKAFRLGDRVQVEVAAEYYFGGPVADAAIELLVYQRPYYHFWEPRRDYPWLFEDFARTSWPADHGPGQIVRREMLKTDARGRAVFAFDSDRNAGHDLEYRVEARVTDLSRREISGAGSVRVTRQRHYVHLTPEHNLYRPGDEVTVAVKALDANGEPAAIEGEVTVTRDRWVEVWIDPSGKEVSGEELDALRRRHPVFPPRRPDFGPPHPGTGGPWRLKFRGYHRDEVLVQKTRTSAEGEAEVRFRAERDGYYRTAWRSEDGPPGSGARPITAETAVWAATNDTTELGYRHGDLEVIVDRDTFQVGREAAVMLTVPTPGRWVLFTVEGDELYHHRVVHVEGTVKLIHLAIEEMHVPNVFLGAVMVSDRQVSSDVKQVVVPPERQCLRVEIASDQGAYEPRGEGAWTVTTRDHEGKPIAAEVSFGLVDESVYYIQKDYAGDPRQRFWGEKRVLHVETHSTFHQKSYAKLVRGAGTALVEEGRWEDDLEVLRDDQYYFDENEKLEREAGAGGSRRGWRGRERKELAARMLSVGDMGRDQAPESLALEGGGGGSIDFADGAAAASAPGAVAEPAGEEPAVEVRTDFRATVIWQPDITTGEDGTATLTVKYPDSLTRWKATARAASSASQFGIAESSVRTRQPLMVRLQAPRFFLAGDTVAISGVIQNSTEETLAVRPELEAAGLEVTGILVDGRPLAGGPSAVAVPAGGEARVDWVVQVPPPPAAAGGEARVRVTVRSGKHADAMERTFPVHEHGIEKLIAKSGKVRGKEVAVTLDLPARRKETTSLEVQVTPSLAVAMLDALPYLIDYPYGCTEQTLSRFLPAVITLRTLRGLDLSPEEIAGRMFGGIEARHAAKTHSGGKKDLALLDDMVAKGLERLRDFQHPDGGWGWWKEGESDHFMTAYVVWGLSLARDAGVEVEAAVIERGAAFLDKEIVEAESQLDLQAWMLHALAAAARNNGAKKGATTNGGSAAAMSRFQETAFANLWKGRDDLNAYSRALLALAAHAFGRTAEAKTLARNLANGVKIDRAPDTSIVQRGVEASHAAVIPTAHWGEDGISWRWSEGGVEATAFALRALLAIEPESDLIEAVTHWLVKNRRGSQWRNTRDSAIAVLALNDYLAASRELEGGIEYEILVNGRSVARHKVAPLEVLAAPSRIAVPVALLADGPNEVRIVRHDPGSKEGGAGETPIYFAAHATFFSLEEPIAPAGSEIFVRRQYYKLSGRKTLLKGWVYDRVPLDDGATVTSGERIEVVVHVETKNHAEYLLIEDLKPAGFEAVEARSGAGLNAEELRKDAAQARFAALAGTPPGAVIPAHFTGRSRWVYQELRDRKVALFIDRLPEGIWELRYELRAEAPGSFHALPVLAHAMYVPEIRANGAETRIGVRDREGREVVAR